MGLNLIAVVEPYFRYPEHFRSLQKFIVFGARYFLFPFFLYAGYCLARMIIIRITLFFYRHGYHKSKVEQQLRDTSPLEQRSVETTPSPLRHYVATLKDSFSGVFGNTRAFFLSTFRHGPATLWCFVVSSRAILGLIYKSILYAYGITCFIFLFIEMSVSIFLVIKASFHPVGAIAFLKTCNQCHGYNRPLNFNHTQSVWVDTLNRMIRHSSVLDKHFPTERREDILGFISALRSYSDRRLLLSKCFFCHKGFRTFNNSRTKGEWELLIDRIQKQNPFYLTPRQATQVLQYITQQWKWTRDDPPGESTGSKLLEKKLLFEHKCGICHTLDIIFLNEAVGADWVDILARMGEKEPGVLSTEESFSLLPYIAQWSQDKKRFQADFPHSSMREKRGE